jgi:hypothetical protein
MARRIETATDDALSIEKGALYPGLHRLEARGHVSARWATGSSNRRVRIYRITRAGICASPTGRSIGMPSCGRSPGDQECPMGWKFWSARTADGEADIHDEIASHVALRAEENIARGLTPEKARREAERRFGPIDPVVRALARIERRRASLLRAPTVDRAGGPFGGPPIWRVSPKLATIGNA